MQVRNIGVAAGLVCVGEKQVSWLVDAVVGATEGEVEIGDWCQGEVRLN